VYSVIVLVALGGGPGLAVGFDGYNEGNIPTPPPANSHFGQPGSPTSSVPVQVYSTVPPPPAVAYVPTPNLAPAAATLLVRLPADARLLIDGDATVSTGAARRFASPPLTMGRTYYYRLTAEVLRDGQRLTATQRVAVRAGQENVVELAPAAFSVAGK
jgi:uncharacterized protein (TIGR03000 family)